MSESVGRVLLLGSSGMVFSDTGPSGTLASLLNAELTRREPSVQWMCDSEEIPPAKDMAARVVAAVERGAPDVVLLSISASYFTYDYIVARVRRRWPRFYPLAQRLAGDVKLASGGGFAGGGSLRGQVFKAPQWLALHVLGAEPYIKLDHAIQNTADALEELARRQGLVCICKLPTMNTNMSDGDMLRYRPRLQEFNTRIVAVCERHGIPVYDLQAELAAEGKQEVRVDDGLHANLATRTWEAAFVAGLILERVALKFESGGP